VLYWERGAEEKLMAQEMKGCESLRPLDSRLLEIPWDSGRFAVVLDDVLSQHECDILIARAEEAGFVPALVNVGGGLELLKKDIRDSDRSIIDDPEMMELLWQRIIERLDGDALNALKNVPASHWVPVGLNERMRILRYDPGGFFSSHYDGAYTRRGDDAGGKERAGEVSFVTCQLYLSENVEGGATRLMNEDRPSEGIDVTPKIGRVLLFEHHIFHCGATIHKGRKYCLRTDLMYAPVSKARAAPNPTYKESPIVLRVKGGDKFSTP
jgi:2OG-Fe(II) oxygenase superfamily